MELLFPWVLAGLVVVPGIFLWGLLAPRGRPLVVGSLMLWRRVLGSGPAGRPSARVRLRDPLLWLDAAAIALLVLASAQPSVRTSRPVDPVATLVIDRTAAMAVVPAGKDHERWRDASAMVRGLLAALGDAPIRVITVPDTSGSVAAQTTTISDLLAEGDAAWSPLPADRQVWPIAASEAAGRSDRPVIVAAALAPKIDLPANAYVLAPGGDAANAAIMRAAARIEADRWWLLVAAKAGSGAPPSGLVVEADGKTLAARPAFPEPHPSGEPSEAEEVFAMAGPPPRQVTVRLVAAGDPPSNARPAADALAWDNAAYLALGASTHLRILMTGAPDPALRRALEARGDTDVAASGAGEAPAAGDADIVVANRAAVPPRWAGPAVVILPQADVGPIHPTGEMAPGEWRVAPEHPLSESLYLEPPQIGEVERFRVDPAAQVLLGTRGLPLVATWEGEEGGSRRIAVLMDIAEPATDWSRRPSFPIFWSRALDWLLPKDRRAANLRTFAPLEPMPEVGIPAPAGPGFHKGAKGEVFGVSFIGSEAAMASGPARDDSAAAADAIRRSVEAGRRATLIAVWPILAAAAIAVLLARAWLAR